MRCRIEKGEAQVDGPRVVVERRPVGPSGEELAPLPSRGVAAGWPGELGYHTRPGRLNKAPCVFPATALSSAMKIPRPRVSQEGQGPARDPTGHPHGVQHRPGHAPSFSKHVENKGAFLWSPDPGKSHNLCTKATILQGRAASLQPGCN